MVFCQKTDTEKILQEIGFRNIQVFLADKELNSVTKKNTFFS